MEDEQMTDQELLRLAALHGMYITGPDSYTDLWYWSKTGADFIGRTWVRSRRQWPRREFDSYLPETQKNILEELRAIVGVLE